MPEDARGRIDQIETPTREYDLDAEKKWVCPDCGHEERRHGNSKTRPFCDPCDWQHAVLIEMVPFENGERVRDL